MSRPCVLVAATALFAALTLASGRVLQQQQTRFAGRLVAGRIVGGEAADIHDFPYQVSFRNLGRHFCGGSIISKSFVLTAGHCAQTGVDSRTGEVSAGSASLVIGVRYRLSGITTHPSFNAHTVDFDVAVIEIKGAFALGETLNVVRLAAEGEELPEASAVTASGWGVTKENDFTLPSQLLKVDLRVVNQQTCSDAYAQYGGVTDRMLCAADVGKDSCQGDSGGPLVSGGIGGSGSKQVGIVSWGLGCARRGFPGVYTRIANKDIRRFIAATAGV